MENNIPKTPFFLVRETKIRENLEILKSVCDRSGCQILLAQKAFSMYRLYPLIGKYIAGTAASGLYEARLGHEEMGLENHVFSPAYRDDEIDEIISICDHIVFNTPSQVKKYGRRAVAAGKSIGLRINPECSTQEGHAIYDPCAPFSRMGTTLSAFKEEMTDEDIALLSGFHFHTLCEQNSDDLATTLKAVEERFGPWLSNLKWINFGGGHHITRKDYDIDLLVDCIVRIRERHGLNVYLEPGEAVALNAGSLFTRVLDTMENGKKIAILDASAACHMPDVIEMPYRPPLFNEQPDGKYEYRLAGPTCLAGDVIGDYRFSTLLKEGDVLEFGDMAIYTMVKTNTFNGMKLPDIYLETESGMLEKVREFGYNDFKGRI